MPTSLKEQVLQKLVTFLKEIKVSNGYALDVRTVTRAPFVTAFESRDAPILFVEGVEEEFAGLPNMRSTSTMQVSIAGGLVPKDQSLTTLNRLATELNEFEDAVRRHCGTMNALSLDNLVTSFVLKRAASDLGILFDGRAMFSLEFETTFTFQLGDPSSH